MLHQSFIAAECVYTMPLPTVMAGGRLVWGQTFTPPASDELPVCLPAVPALAVVVVWHMHTESLTSKLPAASKAYQQQQCFVLVLRNAQMTPEMLLQQLLRNEQENCDGACTNINLVFTNSRSLDPDVIKTSH